MSKTDFDPYIVEVSGAGKLDHYKKVVKHKISTGSEPDDARELAYEIVFGQKPRVGAKALRDEINRGNAVLLEKKREQKQMVKDATRRSLKSDDIKREVKKILAEKPEQVGEGIGPHSFPQPFGKISANAATLKAFGLYGFDKEYVTPAMCEHPEVWSALKIMWGDDGYARDLMKHVTKPDAVNAGDGPRDMRQNLELLQRMLDGNAKEKPDFLLHGTGEQDQMISGKELVKA